MDALLRTVESALDTPPSRVRKSLLVQEYPRRFQNYFTIRFTQFSYPQETNASEDDEGIGLSSAMTNNFSPRAPPHSSPSPSSVRQSTPSATSQNSTFTSNEESDSHQIVQHILSNPISPITDPSPDSSSLQSPSSRMSSMMHPKPPPALTNGHSPPNRAHFRKVKKSPIGRTNSVTPAPEIITYEQEILMKESAEIHEPAEPSGAIVSVLPPINHKNSVLPPLVIKNGVARKSLRKYEADRPIFGAGVQQAERMSVEDTREDEEGRDSRSKYLHHIYGISPDIYRPKQAIIALIAL